VRCELYELFLIQLSSNRSTLIRQGKVGASGGTALFVFGHSFTKNDTHVFNMIGRGNTAHLFVSLHGDPNSKGNMRIQANIEQIAELRHRGDPLLKVNFFDAASAKVWG
jgi:hypothetical protein